MLRLEQERSAQLETYAADLSRTYGELRRHLHHMTVLHEANIRIASALDPEEVLAGVLDSLGQLLPYHTAAVYLLDLDAADACAAAARHGPAAPFPQRPRQGAARGVEGGEYAEYQSGDHGDTERKQDHRGVDRHGKKVSTKHRYRLCS